MKLFAEQHCVLITPLWRMNALSVCTVCCQLLLLLHSCVAFAPTLRHHSAVAATGGCCWSKNAFTSSHLDRSGRERERGGEMEVGREGERTPVLPDIID